MNISPEAKQAAENERDPAEGREIGYYVQQAIDAATAKLREELEESSDETWLEALKFLGLEPVIYDMGETREETISHICSLYGRQVEKLKEQLAHQRPSPPSDGLAVASAPTPEKRTFQGSGFGELEERNIRKTAREIWLKLESCFTAQDEENLIAAAIAQARAPFATANLRLVAALQEIHKEADDSNECDNDMCPHNRALDAIMVIADGALRTALTGAGEKV